MDLNLAGKVAIVTGSGRGIGRTTALTFCREGAKVVIDDIDFEAAKLVEAEGRALGAQAMAIVADVTKPDEVEKMVKTTLDNFGRIDILVNNVGILYINGKPAATGKLFEETTEDDWMATLNVTLYGVLNCSKAVLETMLKQQSGNVINISSEAAIVPQGPRSGTYGAGKGGIISFTRNLAYELGPQGIRVNCVAPGTIRTSQDKATKARMEEALKRAPLGRLGDPQEVANVIAFLASDVSSYVTGQTICVNSGLVMS